MPLGIFMRTLICSIIFSLITFPLLAADRETTRQMQILLNSYGFSAGLADGAIGPKTRAAIASAYEATGAVWDGTLKASDITHLQQLLRQSNYTPKAGIFIENNKSKTLLFPPENPSITHTKYAFGRFWVQADWNQDGLEDYLFTGTMVPTNQNSTGEDTGGACGGDVCRGEMPGPTLFLQQSDGTYLDQSTLFIDQRKSPGQSLSRQNLVADFNNDGRPDLFIADHGYGTHKGFRDSYFLSQKDGTWLESSQTHLSHPNYRIFDHGAAVGDIDNDGDFDLVLTELKNQLTCWKNDGSGRMKKSKCGTVNAFAIELADMDQDGDLDLVHAGHEFGGSTPTGIVYNNGRGVFGSPKRLPQMKLWGTVPELSIWDLDGDGDNDIVLSRAKRLYVGTAIQVLENKGNGDFASTFYPLVVAPDSYKAVHEGNEWNSFVAKILFSDVDRDGDADIVLSSGGGSDEDKTRQVRAAILRNDGNMQFTHLKQGDADNPMRILEDELFQTDPKTLLAQFTYKSGAAQSTKASQLFAAFLKESGELPSQDLDGFVQLEEPIYFNRTGAAVLGVKDASFEKLAGRYDLLIEWAGHIFPIAVCVEHYKQYNFTGTRVSFEAPYGFGDLAHFERFGTHECRARQGGAIGAWEVAEDATKIGFKAFLEDLQQHSRILISVLPTLSDRKKVELLSVFK